MRRATVLLVLVACSPSKHGQVARAPGGVLSAEPGNPPPPPPPPPPSIQPDEDDGLHVIGAIPKDSIHRVVRENFASIRQCYEQVVMSNPGLQGRVIAKFTVGLDGTVQDASATGVHPDLETCVATQVRKFKFPRPDGVKGDVIVEYPFTFKPG